MSGCRIPELPLRMPYIPSKIALISAVHEVAYFIMFWLLGFYCIAITKPKKDYAFPRGYTAAKLRPLTEVSAVDSGLARGCLGLVVWNALRLFSGQVRC